MNVLVINCGSSSLKYQLINSDTEEVLAKGLCERIGIDGRLVYQKAGCDKEITSTLDVKDAIDSSKMAPAFLACSTLSGCLAYTCTS